MNRLPEPAPGGPPAHPAVTARERAAAPAAGRRRAACHLACGLWLGLAVAVALPVAPRAQPADEAPPVVVATARREPFADRVEALGTTRANDSVDVTASVTEKVVEIRFDDGDAVREGDVLVVLDRSEEEAALSAAQAVHREKRLAFERIERLQSQQVAAQAELDLRRAEFQTAQAEIEVVRAQIGNRTVRAPFDGVVGLRDVSVGALVRPGDVITTLDDVSVMKLDFSVPTVHLEALRPGLAVTARSPALPERRFSGEVSTVATQVDPVTRTVAVRALLPNPDGALRPGLLMEVELDKSPRQALIVPEEALIPRGQRTRVMVVDAEERVALRDVETGSRRPGEVEILAGLADGERVVTEGHMRLRPGQRVRPRSADAADPSAGAGGASHAGSAR